MKLIDDFFHILQMHENESGFVYTIALNKDHFIYRAHFPGNPITPGVCIIQLCKELMEHRLKRPLFVRRALNVKFLSVINPEACDTLQVVFSKVATVDDGCKVAVSICRDDTQFARASLFFQWREIRDSKLEISDSRFGIRDLMKQAGVCTVIPTYNNNAFLSGVLDAVLQYAPSVIVVNDGSTDGTEETLNRYRQQIKIVSYSPNRGKGHALRRGFDEAEKSGYSYALTMDSDGQHDARDIPKFVEALRRHPDSMIIGSRNLRQENMPAANTFANRFSNFWFTMQTGIRLPDTQTGFRLYPLKQMKGMRTFSSRYEAELELLIRSAWRNIPLHPIPVRVRYLPEGERVTHFRPGIDFLRISILNTLAVVGAIFYGYPARLFRRLKDGI
ncbi:MAG: glycosyltransferase [Tannerella sp.]|jgi:3-hydroxymyristoyl/3-hydroxydecanoyl-(acyl carrier protein) dehydratase|nr:glycosyltransferase [Tannerella sp.]